MVRVKDRYLLVNIVYPEATTDKQTVPDFVALHQPTTDSLVHQHLVAAIKNEIRELFGDYGVGSVERSLYVKYLSHATSTVILRVGRGHFRLVWAALTMMKKVPVNNGRQCVFRVVHVSGSIRKCEEEAIRRAKALLSAAKEAEAGQGSSALAKLLQKTSATDVDVGPDDDADKDEIMVDNG